jgi:hypothetical protein
MVNLSKVFATFPANPRQQISELSKTTIKHLFTQKPSRSHFEVDIFNKNHVRLVAQIMASLKMKILSSIGYLMVESSNFSRCSFPVLTALLFTRCPALQHFKPTLQISKKPSWFDSEIVASHQKRFKTNINTDSTSKRNWIGYFDIAPNCDYCIPDSSSCSRYNSDSLNVKSIWNWTMLIDFNFANLRKLDFSFSKV